MREVEPTPVPIEPYAHVFGAERMNQLHAEAEVVRKAVGDRTVWHVNSTPTGGGVAEMLQTLLPLSRAFGVDARWLVIDGDPELFEITKRLGLWLYGSAGDGGPL